MDKEDAGRGLVNAKPVNLPVDRLLKDRSRITLHLSHIQKYRGNIKWMIF